MSNLINTCAIVLVGCLWGCTNPLLRRASISTEVDDKKAAPIRLTADEASHSVFQRIMFTVNDFRRVQIYLPYLCNQLGSFVFYLVLSRTNLSLAVPVCNALALVFSVATSYYLGERVDKPIQTLIGAAMVVAGVKVCLAALSQHVVAKDLIAERL
jgi:drug/metabolite transporter (DMT)-like permease